MKTLGALISAAALLVGCDVLGPKYEPAELPLVLKGMVPSASDRYRIAMPTFAAMTKNTAIAREGSVFAIVVGPDLRGITEKYGTEGVDLGVHLVKAERRYLVVERVFTADEEIDLFENIDKLRFRRPMLVGQQDIPHDKFARDLQLCEMPPHARELPDMVERKVYISEFRVERHEVPPELLPAVPALASMPRAGGRYFLTSAGADYLVASDDPMTRLMLDFLITENREFRGGIVVSEVFPRSIRRGTRVAGQVTIRWIELGGTLYYRAV